MGARWQIPRNRGVVNAGDVDSLLDTLGLNELGRTGAARFHCSRAGVKPSVLLLDKPLSSLDPTHSTDVQRWLRGVIGTLWVTTLTVSHDISEALLLGRSYWLL